MYLGDFVYKFKSIYTLQGWKMDTLQPRPFGAVLAARDPQSRLDAEVVPVLNDDVTKAAMLTPAQGLQLLGVARSKA